MRSYSLARAPGFVTQGHKTGVRAFLLVLLLILPFQSFFASSANAQLTGKSTMCLERFPLMCSAGMCTGFVLHSVTDPSVMAYSCTLVGSANAMCAPTGMFMIATYATESLFGTGTAASPMCTWNCCADPVLTISMSSGDGLPVELMDFSVESEDDSDDAASAHDES